MPITLDQRATLQLLLERGKSYSDLAALLGVDESEVRSRARAALTQLGGADPDRTVALTDYILGQADPIDRADVSRHLREDADDRDLATELIVSLRALFPAAELPRLPGESRGGRFRSQAGAAATQAIGLAPAGPKLARPDFSDSRTRLLAALAAGALVLVVAVLAITGAFGGDGDESSAAAAGEETTTAAAAGRGDPDRGADRHRRRRCHG